MPKHPYVQYFPFDKIRPEQKRAIEFAIDQFESGKKHVLLEMGTGTGKSATGIAIARYMEMHGPVLKNKDGDTLTGAYIVTTQKILQDQYMFDFGPASGKNLIRTIKSSSNYRCKFYEDQTCAESKRLLVKLGKQLNGTDFQKHCKNSCHYSIDKQEFIDCPISITNMPYFLAETLYSGKLEPRALLIVDECVRGNAKILIDVGQECSMSEIYENHDVTHVMSYNQEKDEYERKRIIRRVRMSYEKNTEWFEIVAMSDELKSSKIIITGNHKIWTKNRGYVRADELILEDVVKLDTFKKHDVTRNFIVPRAGKRSVESRKSKEKVSCSSCSKLFLKSGISAHKKSILEFMTCLNDSCSKVFEITKSSFGKKYCSHSCFSSANETRQLRSERMIKSNPMFNVDVLNRMKNSWRHNWDNVRTEASKLEQIKRFKDAPLHQNRKKPNNLEKSIIDMNITGLVFTGLGEKWVTFKNGKHKNPDFVVKGTNKVVEVGDVYFWHNEKEIEETIKHYSEIGYECLYLTNKEIKESSEKSFLKLQKFVCNHDVKISSIRKIQKPKNWSANIDHYKYNIEVEDNHNYFANSILVSNCHNTESELGKFVEVSFSERFARDILKCKMPKLDSQQAVLDWVNTTYKRSLNKYTKSLEKNIASLSGDVAGGGDYSKQLEMLEKHLEKIDKFIETYVESNWVMNVTHPDPNNKRGGRKFEFKPIDVSPYGQGILFRSGGRILMMSATIVDKDVFCMSVGVDTKEVAYLRIPSPFPVENRPTHFIPAGSMSRDNIDRTLPIMVETVRMLLEKHSSEKGIIHSSNYKVAKYIQENIKSSRVLIHDSLNRDEILRRHMESKDPTVLLSPSMMEGVDLRDDQSRFQILCKIPFPYLGDAVVKKRMDRNKSWYSYMTAKSVIQSFGRSIRNDTDHAITYILDADWDRFYTRNFLMFPEDFRKCIIT